MAAYNSYVVEYKHGSTWYTISNVQALTCFVGRELPVNQWSVSTTSIRVWYPEGYDSPIANLALGSRIRFFCPGRSSSKPTWTGYVSNMTVEIGIPWNSLTNDGNSDFLVIDCEGEFGKFGRVTNVYRNDPGSLTVPSTVKEAINGTNQFRYLSGVQVPNTGGPALVGTSGGTCDVLADPQGSPTCGPFSPQDFMQNMAILAAGRIVDGIRKPATTGDWSSTNGAEDDPAIYFSLAAVTDANIATVTFSDTTNNATNRQYDDIRFDGMADNVVNNALITFVQLRRAPTANDTAQVQANADTPNGPPSGYNANSVDTDGQTVAPAQTQAEVRTQVANYYANVWNSTDIDPVVVSATTNGQHTQNLDTLGFADLELGYLPTKAVNVVLRGDTYLCRIEGVQLTADLNQTRFTYYVSPADVTGWFILDSADLGVLDQNKLGLY